MAEAGTAVPRPVEVITFGCRLNGLESEVMRRHALAAGLTDTVIVHTCAVTAEAERQARQAIRRARRQRPAATIVVTGCSAQLAAERYAAMPEVDRIIGNAEKLRASSWAAPGAGPPPARVQVGDIMELRATAHHLIDGFDGRTRAFLEVQGGCDHRCTFCVIPYGRGPSRSVPVERVVAQARMLVEAGYRELVVTGVDLTSYGKDLPGAPELGGMLRQVLTQVPELPRLRLSSIDPAEIDPALEELVGHEPRLMPHLHLSVQAGDDLVLKRMRRRHARGDVVALTTRLRAHRPDLVFGADLIAGFPTEDATMFVNTLRLIDDAGLTFLHVFPYSPRPGTPAARMPQVDANLRKERAARLRAGGDEALDRFLRSQVGTRRRALVEREGAGHTDQFAPLKVRGDPPPAGTIAEFCIKAVEGRVLAGARLGAST